MANKSNGFEQLLEKINLFCKNLIKMEKQRIAIDMDEVLADVIAKFEALYKKNHPKEALRQQQDGEEFYAILPDHISGDFRKHIYEKGFFRDLEVIKDSQRVVKELSKKYDVFYCFCRNGVP